MGPLDIHGPKTIITIDVPTVVEGDFEWDSAKADSNLAKHGVSFAEAATVFADPSPSTSTMDLGPVIWF